MTAPHSRMSRRPRRARLLTVAAIALALTGLGVAPPAATAPPPGNTGAGAPASSSGPQPLPLTGLHASSYTVTLITGDQITLTETGTGRYTATARFSPGSSPTVTYDGRTNPNGATALYAKPLAARALIDTGRLNPGLFDVVYLAEHGFTGAQGQIPVTIRYAGHPDATTMTAKARSLPGATIEQTLPASSEVKATVAADHAAAFWTALTGDSAPTTAAPAVATHLANDVAEVSLTGHETPGLTTHYVAQPGQAPATTVTETIIKKTGEVRPSLGCANPGPTTLCLTSPSLIAVAGSAAGTVFGGVVTCLDANPCTTMQVRFTVPPGVYEADEMAIFTLDGQSQFLGVLNPQITVAGDTQFTIDADAAQKVTVSGPQPVASDPFYTSKGFYRSLPNGKAFVSFFQGAYGHLNSWVTTGGGRVTIGSFHLMNMIQTGPPPVTMTVTSPQRLDLRPLYPYYSSTADLGKRPMARFSGKQTLTLVDGGYGRADDLAGLDLRGKLVLLRLFQTDLDHGSICFAYTDELQRALHAGAAGVLIDPSDLKFASNSIVDQCQSPVQPPWFGLDHTATEAFVDIPYVTIPPSKASALRGQLAHGSVQINVTDNGPAKYLYSVSPTTEGHLPDSEHYAFTSDQLTTVENNIHATGPLVESSWAAFRPNDNALGGALYDYLPPSVSVPEYVGPDSPDIVWQRAKQVFSDQIPTTGIARATLNDVFAQHGGSATDDWFTQPAAPGTPQGVFDAAAQAQPVVFDSATVACASCRQGNTFYPIFYRVSDANPRVDNGGTFYSFGSTGIHLYDAAGTEIPQTPYGLPTPDPSTELRAATYTMPSQPARYRLTADDANTHTTWHFTSAEPATDQTPRGFKCLDTIVTGATTPCHADPLVFLRYNAFTDVTDSVTAPGGHKLQVTGYHQDPDAPPVTSLKVWISTDGGATWQPTHLTDGQNGTWTASYTLPQLSQTDGHLSIKATATDAAGNDVTQTILDTVNLATSSGHAAGR